METGISLHRGPARGPGGGGSITGDFERQMKESSGNGASLSMGALRGEPGGGPLYWGLCRICKGRLWSGTSLFIQVPVRNLNGGFV